MRPVYVTGSYGTPYPPDEDAVMARVPADAVEDHVFATAKGWRRMSWPSKLAYIATAGALDQAGLDATALESSSIGLVIGSRYGCLSLFEEFHQVLRDEGPRAVSPTVFTTGVLNAPVGHASLGQGLRGPCHTIVGAEAVGLEAVALAWELVQTGQVERVVAVGVEEAPEILRSAMRAGGALPPGRRISEGAAALVVDRTAGGGLARVGAVATGRCGRRGTAVQTHAELIRVVATGADVGGVWLPGHAGADGERERRAVRLALGEAPSLEASVAPMGYAPGFVTADIASHAALATNSGASVIATAAGGHGTTVAIRFDPVS